MDTTVIKPIVNHSMILCFYHQINSNSQMKREGFQELEENFSLESPLFIGSLLFMGRLLRKNEPEVNRMRQHVFPIDWDNFNGNEAEYNEMLAFEELPPLIAPMAARPDPPRLREGQKLFFVAPSSRLGRQDKYHLSRKQPDGLFVSLDDILLKKLFLLLSTINRQVSVEYYVENRIPLPELISSEEFVLIRMEFHLEKSIFSQEYNSLIEKLNKQFEIEKRMKRQAREQRGKGVTKKREEASNRVELLNKKICSEIGNRQLIMTLFKQLGIRVKQPALVTPDISQNQIALHAISDDFVKNRTKFNIQTKFDYYCAKQRSRVFGRLIASIDDLQYIRDSGTTFSRLICLPYLKKFLTVDELIDTNKFETLLLSPTKSKYPVLGDFIVDYLTYDTMLSKDLKDFQMNQALRETFYKLRRELQQEFKEQESKLHKSFSLNTRTMEKKTKLLQKLGGRKRKKVEIKAPYKELDLIQLYGIEDPKNFIQLARYRRNMMKLLSRRDNNIAFQEFEDEIKNIREHQQPERITSELMPHQRQALTWMKYRQRLIPAKQVLRDDYKKSKFDADRQIGAYWEHLQLANNKAIYINHFTGGFSERPVPWQQVSGGILAFEMGLGKTVSALALMVEPSPEKNGDKVLKQQCGHNLFITISSMVPNQIESLLRKHLKSPLNYYIYDRNTRKQDVDLSQFEIVVTSYNTIVSDYNDLPPAKQLKLQLSISYGGHQEPEKERNSQEPQIEHNPNELQRHNKRSFRNVYNYHWSRIFIDEAHHIRNRNTSTSEAVTSLKGASRWCLSGSPVLNDKSQLFALCKFLRIQLFSDWTWWSHFMGKSNLLEEGFGILHRVLRPILLQRSKHSTDRLGNPIIELPQRHNHVEFVDFDARERKAYIALETSFKKFIQLAMENELSDSQQQKVIPFTLLLRLRQFCVNPFLALRDRDESAEQFLLVQAKKYFQMPIQEILDEQEFSMCVVCLQDDEQLQEMKCGHMICSVCLEESEEMVDPTLYDCQTCKKRGIEVEPPIARQTGSLLITYFSSKLQKVIELAAQILSSGEKCIIFTMWIDVMEQLAYRLLDLGFRVVAVHSKVKKQLKQEILASFKEDSLQGIVTSLRSCGQGLNLIEANNVIIVEPEWNPAIEQQGIDRVYRIGQRRVVKVYRVIVKNSIEEKLRDLHEKKNHEAHYALMNKQFFQKKKYLKTLLEFMIG